MAKFNEDEFRLGWTHAENDGPAPRTASRSFLEGYVAALESSVTADRAPGWNTVAPDFEKVPDGETTGMGDNTNTEKKDLMDVTLQVRDDLAHKLDRQNELGQHRDNGTMQDLEGWDTAKKSSLAQFKTAELAREIARRTVAENPKD